LASPDRGAVDHFENFGQARWMSSKGDANLPTKGKVGGGGRIDIDQRMSPEEHHKEKGTYIKSRELPGIEKGGPY